jgi:hypothetical protein
MQTKAFSVYNSLQATVIQQATNGLQFQFSYDYSKSMDTMSGSLDGTTGTVRLRPHPPFSVEDASGGSYSGVGQSRASFAPGITTAQAKLTGRTEDRLTHYFNTEAFVPAGGYYGNSRRNILRGPLQRNLDLSLIKDTTLHESLNIEFRSEFFNIMNYSNFNSPDSSISSASSYGVI